MSRDLWKVGVQWKERRPDGNIRHSQVVSTYGPGALVDLVEDAAIVAGLQWWAKGPQIVEDRLLAMLARQPGYERVVLHAPPPSSRDLEDPNRKWIKGFRFPEWFACQNEHCGVLPVRAMDDRWLDTANPADLETVASALLDGRISSPFTAGSLQRVGISEAGRLLESLAGTDPTVVAWTLRRIARERRAADDRYASVARLVWSGAVEGEQAIRDTRVVLDELFARAERHVLISTFIVFNGRAVFSALGKRLRERPNLQVDVFMHLPERDGEFVEIREYLEEFARVHWPERTPMPALYFDPEVTRPGAKRTTLHAKCVVVDDRWAFVTSANFTEAAQERNIEAGVLLDHPRIAEALAARFRALREAGRLRRMVP